MNLHISRVLICLFLLWGYVANAALLKYDSDVVISSAINIDNVWSISIKDISTNKSASFDTTKNQTKIGIKLLSFNPDDCTAIVESARGVLNIALAKASNSDSLDFIQEDDKFADESEEIIAAMEGKVTKKYRASLWKRLTNF